MMYGPYLPGQQDVLARLGASARRAAETTKIAPSIWAQDHVLTVGVSGDSRRGRSGGWGPRTPVRGGDGDAALALLGALVDLVESDDLVGRIAGDALAGLRRCGERRSAVVDVAAPLEVRLVPPNFPPDPLFH